MSIPAKDKDDKAIYTTKPPLWEIDGFPLELDKNPFEEDDNSLYLMLSKNAQVMTYNESKRLEGVTLQTFLTDATKRPLTAIGIKVRDHRILPLIDTFINTLMIKPGNIVELHISLEIDVDSNEIEKNFASLLSKLGEELQFVPTIVVLSIRFPVYVFNVTSPYIKDIHKQITFLIKNNPCLIKLHMSSIPGPRVLTDTDREDLLTALLSSKLRAVDLGIDFIRSVSHSTDRLLEANLTLCQLGSESTSPKISPNIALRNLVNTLDLVWGLPTQLYVYPGTDKKNPIAGHTRYRDAHNVLDETKPAPVVFSTPRGSGKYKVINGNEHYFFSGLQTAAQSVYLSGDNKLHHNPRIKNLVFRNYPLPAITTFLKYLSDTKPWKEEKYDKPDLIDDPTDRINAIIIINYASESDKPEHLTKLLKEISNWEALHVLEFVGTLPSMDRIRSLSLTREKGGGQEEGEIFFDVLDEVPTLILPPAKKSEMVTTVSTGKGFASTGASENPKYRYEKHQTGDVYSVSLTRTNPPKKKEKDEIKMTKEKEEEFSTLFERKVTTQEPPPISAPELEEAKKSLERLEKMAKVWNKAREQGRVTKEQFEIFRHTFEARSNILLSVLRLPQASVNVDSTPRIST